MYCVANRRTEDNRSSGLGTRSMEKPEHRTLFRSERTLGVGGHEDSERRPLACPLEGGNESVIGE